MPVPYHSITRRVEMLLDRLSAVVPAAAAPIAVVASSDRAEVVYDRPPGWHIPGSYLITSGLADLMADDGLYAILAHESGHRILRVKYPDLPQPTTDAGVASWYSVVDKIEMAADRFAVQHADASPSALGDALALVYASQSKWVRLDDLGRTVPLLGEFERHIQRRIAVLDGMTARAMRPTRVATGVE